MLAAALEVEQTPFYLESRQAPLVAWLHRTAGACAGGHGIVVCGPSGHEKIHSYRSLRYLAQELARIGLSVLRLDYHGTGDSAGLDEDPERVATWLENIKDAVQWLRRELGCRSISLIGLRMGATLAARVAADSPVENLILWAPVVSGRLFVRELRAISLTAAAEPPRVSDPPEDLEAAGFFLTKQTIDDLQTLDLLTLRPQCQRVLIVARDDLQPDRRLAAHLEAQSISVETIVQPGYSDMMADPHYTKIPQRAISAILSWLRPHLVKEAGSGSEGCLGGFSTEARLAHQPVVGGGLDRSVSIRERLLYLQREPELFGILTDPDAGPLEHLPVVVLLNAGAAYRVGPNRLNVLLARQLAAAGFRSLRIDLRGLGDSPVRAPEPENEPYAQTYFRDIETILDSLQTQFGARRIVLAGLCSGAYFAFQCAAQMTSPALVESLLINPLTYYWQPGMTLEASPQQHFVTYGHYKRSALRPKKWFKLLTGNTRIGLLGVARLAWERLQLLRQANGASSRESGRVESARSPSHPLIEDLPDDLAHAVRAGRHLACFFADTDPGYSVLLFRAKRAVARLRKAGALDVSFISSADHTFTRRTPRRTLLEMLSDHMRQRYLKHP